MILADHILTKIQPDIHFYRREFDSNSEENDDHLAVEIFDKNTKKNANEVIEEDESKELIFLKNGYAIYSKSVSSKYIYFKIIKLNYYFLFTI